MTFLPLTLTDNFNKKWITGEFLGFKKLVDENLDIHYTWVRISLLAFRIPKTCGILVY